MPTNTQTKPNPEMFPDSSLDREHTVEGNKFASREVLSGSEVLRLKTGDVVAKVSCVVDSMIAISKDVPDAPGSMMADLKKEWHEGLYDYHNDRAGKSVIPLINRYHKSRADKHSKKLDMANKVVDWYAGRADARNSEYMGRRNERQEALDIFAKRRVEAEIQRQNRIETEKKTQKLEQAGVDREEIKKLVAKYLDLPTTKARIAEHAIKTVRDKLGG